MSSIFPDYRTATNLVLNKLGTSYQKSAAERSTSQFNSAVLKGFECSEPQGFSFASVIDFVLSAVNRIVDSLISYAASPKDSEATPLDSMCFPSKTHGQNSSIGIHYCRHPGEDDSGHGQSGDGDSQPGENQLQEGSAEMQNPKPSEGTPTKKPETSSIEQQPQPGQSSVQNPEDDYVKPPKVYGNTDGLGIYISPACLPLVRELLKDPTAKALFEVAKKKGLVSITEEPSMLKERIKVNADEVRESSSGESRIRISSTAKGVENLAALAHELVHSATPENGNSKLEEWFAENIGRGVYQRLTHKNNLPEVSQDEVNKKYPSLQNENNIESDLEEILT